MKTLHTMRSTAMLLTLAAGASVSSALVPLASAQAETNDIRDIHDIFSPSVRKWVSGCHCEGGMMAFDPMVTICLTDSEITSVHSGCY